MTAARLLLALALLLLTTRAAADSSSGAPLTVQEKCATVLLKKLGDPGGGLKLESFRDIEPIKDFHACHFVWQVAGQAQRLSLCVLIYAPTGKRAYSYILDTAVQPCSSPPTPQELVKMGALNEWGDPARHRAKLRDKR